MIVELKNSASGYFFSGNITLGPKQTKSFELESLIDAQLLDIIEAVSIKKIEATGLQEIKDKYKSMSGKSAYDVAKFDGFVGTQAEWLESLKGITSSPLSTQTFKDAFTSTI